MVKSLIDSFREHMQYIAICFRYVGGSQNVSPMRYEPQKIPVCILCTEVAVLCSKGMSDAVKACATASRPFSPYANQQSMCMRLALLCH